MPRLLPTFGIFIFIGLYIYAASIYPGGTPTDPNSIGYNWFHNLWCHLMDDNALNGMKNPAKPISIFAIVILGCSMVVFFFQFTKYFVNNVLLNRIIKITGLMAMGAAVLIFTKYHDLMTTILSLCGLVGILSIIRVLHLNKMSFLKITGILCLFIIALNNFFYYKVGLNVYLPIIQLLDFLIVLGWTVAINFKMIGKNATS